MTNYKFTTRSFFISLEIMRDITEGNLDNVSFEELKDIGSLVKKNSVGQIVNFFLNSATSQEERAYALVAIAIEKDYKDVINMDAMEFIDHLTGLIQSIDWEKLVGKFMKILQEEAKDQQNPILT